MTMIFANEYGMTPFEVLSKDIDDFIMIANYLFKLADKAQKSEIKQNPKNDGFWDF